MIYFIDFDNTICPNGDEGIPPTNECRAFITRLLKENHSVVIYSCRSNPACVNDSHAATDAMRLYLAKHHVAYTRIEMNKPYFNYYIDDRNMGTPLDKRGNVDWAEITKLYEKR